MTEREKMLAGVYYNPNESELQNLRHHARTLLHQFNTSGPDAYGLRRDLMRALVGSCGENLHIEPDFRCDYGCNIHVGENFYANFGCVILDAAPVRIGSNCLIAPQVGIYTSTHPLDAQARRSGVESAQAITIGDDCWIGGHAVINPGVQLGNRVVVASGAVVTRSFGDDVLIGGNPARVLKDLALACISHEIA